MRKVVIIDNAVQCPYYSYQCCTCKHPDVEDKYYGCDPINISPHCPLPDYEEESQ